MDKYGWKFASALLFFTTLLAGCAARAPVSADSFEPQSASAETAVYLDLRERLVNGDPAVNFEKLRDAYVKTPYYEPYGGNAEDAFKEANRLAREGDYKGCLDVVHRVEDAAFPMLNLHHHGWECAREVGDTADAAKHELMARNLFQIITAPGDGRSKETAWRALSTQELYLVLAIQGLKAKGQALVQADGRAFDLMTVVPQDGDEEEVRYFDITRQMMYGMKFLDESSE